MLNLWPGFPQKKEMKNIILELADVAGFLWDRRWAERNAGNISVNITSPFPRQGIGQVLNLSFSATPRTYPELSGQLLLITSTGSRCVMQARTRSRNYALSISAILHPHIIS